MLPLKHRLKKREDFAKTFSKGSYTAINDLSIKYIGNSMKESRIGFPVGKNYSKKAVIRNRARRVLQAATYEYLDKLKPGFDIIILIRPTYHNLELQKIVLELGRIFKKANLLI